ncbi:MAG: DUF6491 family protein [Myxococcota bacterium]
MRTTTAALWLGVAACAHAPPDAARTDDCFDASGVLGWDDAGPNSVLLRVRGRREFVADLQGPQCSDVAWATAIGVTSSTGSPWVCVGEGVGLGQIQFRDGPLGSGGRLITCRVDAIRPGP